MRNENRNQFLETLTLEEEFVIKERQTAPFSLLFISGTDNLKNFIFPLYLTEAFLILFLLCYSGQAQRIA